MEGMETGKRGGGGGRAEDGGVPGPPLGSPPSEHRGHGEAGAHHAPTLRCPGLGPGRLSRGGWNVWTLRALDLRSCTSLCVCV